MPGGAVLDLGGSLGTGAPKPPQFGIKEGMPLPRLETVIPPGGHMPNWCWKEFGGPKW